MSTTLLVVGGTDATTERLQALDEAFDVTAVSLSAAVDRLADREDVDCVVVAGETVDLPTALERLAATAPSVPRLAVDDRSLDARAALSAGATDVAPLAEPAVLTRRVHNVVFRQRDGRPAEPATDTKIRRLYAVAADLDDAETEADIYELAVAAAEDILEFSICYVGTVEDGEIRPQAASHDPLLADPVIMSVDEGVAGRTVREGHTFVVDDASADPDAEPVDDSYRSALSIPVGEFGIFQAVAPEHAAFSGQDRKLGELLVSHLASAVERVRYEATLRDERDRFAALFENVPDAVVRYRFEDDEPIIEDVNPTFERTFGYDAGSVLGASLDEVVVPADEHEPAKKLNEAVREGDRLGAEVERLTVDGPRQFLLRNAPFSTSEEHDGWAIYTDIEAQKRRERELQRQNDRLEEFTGMVSHDLRSPLNVATGRIEIADERLDDDHLGEALAALERMNHLIDDLLTLARKGRVVSEPEPTGLAAVAERAWSNVDAPGATLSTGDLRTVPADPSRLQELFENLFRNAVEHGSTTPRSQARQDAVEHGSTSPPSHAQGDAVGREASDEPSVAGAPEDAVERGDRRVAVTVGPTETGFYVGDDGLGIPADEREHVFEPGFTTDAEGTGLGLAIVEEIAAAHGWTVRATDGTDGGARFEFDFGSEVGT